MNEIYPYIIDCHTHNRDSLTGVISLEPHELDVMRPGRVYSVGVHPWRASLATDDDIHRVEEAATRSEVVMIGECGLDRVCVAFSGSDILPYLRISHIAHSHLSFLREAFLYILIYYCNPCVYIMATVS